MRIEVTNIPEEKFIKVSQEILKVLLVNGLTEFESIAINDLKDKYIGCEYELKKQ